MRIDKITKEQQARFGEWTQKWLAVGLSTEPADFDKATAAALEGYRLANLDKPMVILRMGSPYAATMGGALAWAYLRQLKGAQVMDQVRDQVGAQVRDQVVDQVWDQVRSQVGAQVWDQVVAQVRDQVRAQVGDQVVDQVVDQVGAQVMDQVVAQVRAQVMGQLKNAVYNSYGGQLYGADFSAYITFFRDVMGWKNEALDKFSVYETLAQNCGWCWWHQNVLAISDRPRVINRDNRNRLHCENGPSIAYRDGWALYHWHGVLVPADVIEAPEGITVERIRSEQNAEVRRVMIERYGYSRYLDDAGLVLVDSRPEDDPVIGLRTARLFRDDANEIVLLDVLNSTPEGRWEESDTWEESAPNLDGEIIKTRKRTFIPELRDGVPYCKRYTLSIDPTSYGGRAGRECLAASASTWRRADYSLYFPTPEAYQPSAES